MGEGFLNFFYRCVNVYVINSQGACQWLRFNRPIINPVLKAEFCRPGCAMRLVNFLVFKQNTVSSTFLFIFAE
jgi:hypothetical protein